jgi:hypothetical protein
MRARSISRPLGAVAIIISGWIVARTALLWAAAPPVIAPPMTAPPMTAPPMTAPPVPLRAQSAAAPVTVTMPPLSRAHRLMVVAVARRGPGLRVRTPDLPVHLRHDDSDFRLTLSTGNATGVASAPSPHAAPVTAADPLFIPALSLARRTAAHDRVSASGWLLIRARGVGDALATSGTLAGSQAGVRAYYEPGPRGIALTARLSAPLAVNAGRDAAVGIALRRGAVGLIVEQRIALDRGARTAPSVTAFGGIADVRLSGRWTASGYAQLGVVGIARPAGFADGALRIERTVARIGGIKIAAGAGAWGGIQPRLARLDLGPQVSARIPLGTATLRVSGEWRARVLGMAQPGSGAALVIGLDL